MKKKSIISAISAIATFAMCMTAYAGTWEEYPEGRKYRYDDGTYAAWEDTGFTSMYEKIAVAHPEEGLIYLYAFDEQGWLRTEGPVYGNYTAGSDGKRLFDNVPYAVPIVDYELPVTREVDYASGKSNDLISEWKRTLSLDDSVMQSEGYTLYLSNTAIYLADHYIGDALKKYEIESVLKMNNYLNTEGYNRYYIKFKGIPYVCELSSPAKLIDGYPADDYFRSVSDISKSRTAMWNLIDKRRLYEVYGGNATGIALWFSQSPNRDDYHPELPYNLHFSYDVETVNGKEELRAWDIRGISLIFRKVVK